MKTWKKATLVMMMTGGLSVVGSDEPVNVLNASESMDGDGLCESGAFNVGDIIEPKRVSDTSVLIEWDEKKEAVGYGLFVGKEKIGEVEKTEMEIGGLEPSTVYESIKVVPYYLEEKGVPVKVRAFETLPSGDFKPYVHSKGSYSMTLGWKKGKDEVVKVSRNGELLYEGTDRYFTVDNLRSGTQYSTYVWTENSSGDKSEVFTVRGDTLELADNYESSDKQDLREIGFKSVRKIEGSIDKIEANNNENKIIFDFPNRDVSDIHKFELGLDKDSLDEVRSNGLGKDLEVVSPISSMTIPVHVVDGLDVDRVEMVMEREEAKKMGGSALVVSDEWEFHTYVYDNEKRYVIPFLDEVGTYGIKVDEGDLSKATPLEVQAGGKLKTIPYVKEDGMVKIKSMRSGTYVVITDEDNVRDASNSWAEKEIKDLVDRKVVEGFENGEYRPEEPATREQVMGVVKNAVGFGNRSQDFGPIGEFLLVDEDQEILENRMDLEKWEKNVFKSKENVSREEAAYVVYKTLNAIGYQSSGSDGGSFTDTGAIGDYYKEAVDVVRDEGIMVGDNNGKFHPKQELTREQMAVMVSRMLETLGMKEVTEVENTDVDNEEEEETGEYKE